MFNGTGGTANDFDIQKDFIGNIGINRTSKNEKINYAFRISYYDGGWTNGTKYVYQNIITLHNGDKRFALDSAPANKNAISKRIYMGVDFQFTVDWIAGMTTIRGEYIQDNSREQHL